MKIVGFQKISITSPTPHTDGTLDLHPHPAGISRRYLSYPPPPYPGISVIFQLYFYAKDNCFCV